MTFLPEVGPGQRRYQLDFGDDPDHDSDPGSGLRFRSRIRITIQIQDPDYDQNYIEIARIFMQFLTEVCLGPRTNPLNLGMIQFYDPDLGH